MLIAKVNAAGLTMTVQHIFLPGMQVVCDLGRFQCQLHVIQLIVDYSRDPVIPLSNERAWILESIKMPCRWHQLDACTYKTNGIYLYGLCMTMA